MSEKYCRKIFSLNMVFGNFWTGYECCVTTRLFLPNNTMSNNVNHARGMLSPSAMQSTYLQLLTLSKVPCLRAFNATLQQKVAFKLFTFIYYNMYKVLQTA